MSANNNELMQKLFAHMHEHDGRYINYKNQYIGLAPSIEQCRFKDHVTAAAEYAYIIQKALTADAAKSLQDYFFNNLDFEIDEESRQQTGIYFYACIKNLENYKTKSSCLAGCVTSAAEFLRHYEMGERNFSEIFLEGGSLKDLTLEPINLSRARIRNLHLKNLVLTGARVDYAESENISLENSDFSNSILSHSRIEHLTLKNINLQGSCLSNAKLDYVVAEDSSFNEVDFGEIREDWGEFRDDRDKRSKLINSSLVRSRFRNSRIWGLDIKNSDLTEADMTEAEAESITLFENSSHISEIYQVPRLTSTGCLPKGRSLDDFCSEFIAYLSRNGVTLHNTVMPNGKICSNTLTRSDIT